MGLCASASKISGEVLQSFYYKIKGEGSLYNGESNYEKESIKIQVDKLSSQHHPAGQIQVTLWFNGY